MRHVTALAVIASLLTPSLALAQDKVLVFVTSIGAANGRTDPSKDNRDTVKDLQNALDDKIFAVVDRPDDAALVLRVLGRERAQVTVGFFGDAARDVVVRVALEYDGTTAELSGSAQGGTLSTGGAWKRAAGKVADQVKDWARDNEVQ